MFDLIEGAEQYPQFLPWCTSATILERSDEWVAARLEFSYLKVRFGFVTRNPKRRPEWLQIRLVEGPFKHFQGTWTLAALGNSGCKVQFSLTYELADRFFGKVAAPAVAMVSRSMMDAFIKRAQQTLTEVAPAQAVPATQEQAVQPVPAPAAAAQPPTVEPPVDVLPAVPAEAVPTAAAATLPEPAATPTTSPDEKPMSLPKDLSLHDALAASPLGRDLSPEQAAVLASVLRLESFTAGQVLAVEGAPDNHLYVVVDGSLGVVKQRGTADEALLGTLNAGDFAHELGFLDGTERYATLVASTDARALVLERAGLESLVDSHPRILYAVMRAIVRTVHRVQTRLAVQTSELTNYIVKQHGRY